MKHRPCWSCCWGHVHFILLCPFSRGRQHWYVITEKPHCSSCPQMPSKTCCFFITRYYSLSTVGTTDLFSSLCWLRGRWTPSPPPSRPQVVVNAALPVVSLKSDHSGEMELQPKVRSSVAAAWMLIWTRVRLWIPKLFLIYNQWHRSIYKSCGIMQVKVTSFPAMQEEYLILVHDKPVATSPKMLFELSYFDTCCVMFVYSWARSF